MLDYIYVVLSFFIILDSKVWSHWTDRMLLLTKAGTLRAGTAVGGG